jgi:c(7)-type cytochrome triheme protein
MLPNYSTAERSQLCADPVFSLPIRTQLFYNAPTKSENPAGEMDETGVSVEPGSGVYGEENMNTRFWSGLTASLVMASTALAVTGGGDIIFKTEGMTDALFSHDYHVGPAKKKCSECHYQIYTTRAQHKTVGMDGMRKGKSCGACHDGKKAFGVTDKQDCKRCHNIELLTK